MDGKSKGMHAIPANGVNGLVESLCTAATLSGAEIRTGSVVSHLLIHGSADGQLATGVQLVDGEKIEYRNGGTRPDQSQPVGCLWLE